MAIQVHFTCYMFVCYTQFLNVPSEPNNTEGSELQITNKAPKPCSHNKPTTIYNTLHLNWKYNNHCLPPIFLQSTDCSPASLPGTMITGAALQLWKQYSLTLPCSTLWIRPLPRVPRMTAAGFSRSASRHITFPASPSTIRALVRTLQNPGTCINPLRKIWKRSKNRNSQMCILHTSSILAIRNHLALFF